MSNTQLYVLYLDNSINWTNYKLYIQQKYINWANVYGYSLHEPYYENEVDNVYVVKKK
jgi:hypothetical protein